MQTMKSDLNPAKEHPFLWRTMLFYLGYYFGLVGCAAWLWPQPWLLTTIFGVASLTLIVCWFSAQTVFFYLVAFVLGPVGEVIAVRGGAWRYSGDNGAIPVWLPFAWGLTILFILRVAELFPRVRGAATARASEMSAVPAPPRPEIARADGHSR